MNEEPSTSMNKGSARIVVLATCFNRRDTTLRGLRALRDAATKHDHVLYLVDDGSSDGTGEAVRSEFPEATVIEGTGSLFWNGGMRAAWQAAMNEPADYFLLFNDDLELFPGSIDALVEFQRAKEAIYGPRVISVGRVVDPDTGDTTYGGFVVKPGASRLRFGRSPDGDTVCDTMNANCSLIPQSALKDVGILSDAYRHHTGDIDYGLRARNAGYRIFQSAEPVGETPFNQAAVDQVSRLTWSNRHFIFRNPKGIPVKEWLYFCREHGGALWPVNFLVRYLKIVRFG